MRVLDAAERVSVVETLLLLECVVVLVNESTIETVCETVPTVLDAVGDTLVREPEKLCVDETDVDGVADVECRDVERVLVGDGLLVVVEDGLRVEESETVGDPVRVVLPRETDTEVGVLVMEGLPVAEIDVVCVSE